MRVLDAIEALGSTAGGSSSGGHIAMDAVGTTPEPEPYPNHTLNPQPYPLCQTNHNLART